MTFSVDIFKKITFFVITFGEYSKIYSLTLLKLGKWLLEALNEEKAENSGKI